ncbi:expressed unknown protein [Ectocarpus siliculosus]|uniref:FCP1 homology domain-containing protein n=1 Tax=Ectocarpus siliculosus TaxID=2880 RepID=D7G8V3_ECTSI|nr:expressed unknown protein [Ectocarpus siliculosus]|eukprot:CBJ28121.1 expressed unknown protein [Ectocarpus siliculosus]
MEATAVRKHTAAKPSAAAASQGAPRLVHPAPPPDTGDTAAAAGTGVNASCNPTTSPWKEKLNRIVGLCDDAGPPVADLIRPPTNLLAHPRRHRGPGSITDTAEPLAADSPAAGCGGVTSHSSDSNGAVPPRDGNDTDLPLKTKQVLILLDMNGTLLYRAKKPLRVSNDGGGGGGGGDSKWGAPAFVHGENVPLHYYMRPGAAELVAALEAHPRTRLAFYTSMRGVNALPAARFLMPGDSRLLDESGEDVRPFIERNPFQPRASSWLCTEEEEQQDEIVASPPARLSFLQAVELVLTTGPLSREWRDDDGRGGSPVVQVADASEEASPSGEGVAPPTAGRCEGGRSTFEGFGKNVEASVVASVLELLRRATAAAERWGLSPQERERLALWSSAAAATAS